MSFKAFELDGRTAVVIGGTSGIGRAVAHGFGGSGRKRRADFARRIEQVESTAAEIENLRTQKHCA